MSPERDQTPLSGLLTDLLAKEKSISFYRFMDLALHHPEHGYYAKPEPVVGRDGDFMTSPALHPAFGQMLWRQIRQMLDFIGSESPARVMEVGAGAGQMARDILQAARADDDPYSFVYLIREQSDRLRRQQEETITAVWEQAPVAWVDDLAGTTGISLIVMNELMSALPIHRLMYQGDGNWQEVYVCMEDGKLSSRLGPVTEPRAVDVAQASGVQFRVGQIVDVNVDAADMLADLAQCLSEKAFILNIDYGGPARLVYNPSRMHGNVRCYYKQQPVSDLFARPGRQDITADVDFDLLSRVGNSLGILSTEAIPQGVFLLNLGIEEEAESLASRIARGDGSADPELQKVYSLYAPEALGDSFWVMAHAQGFQQLPPLKGFQTFSQRPKSLAELILGATP